MPSFYFPISHAGGNFLEDENVFYAPLQRHGWTNDNGMALILKQQSSIKVLSGQFAVNIDGGTPADAFFKILCAVNSVSTANLAFYLAYRSGSVATDSGARDETLTNQLVSGAGTAKQLITKSIDLVHGNFGDGQLCQYEFGIDGANHAIAADIIVFDAFFEVQT